MDIGINTELERLLPGFRIGEAIAIGQARRKNMLINVLSRGESNHRNGGLF